MTALALDVHGDDLALFCAFTAIREKPHVLVTHRTVPEDEIDAAFEVLGVSWQEEAGGGVFDLLILPEAEEKGHAEHNQVSMFTWASEVPRINYLTYAPRGHRSVWGSEVIPTAKEIALKLRALSCFESQIEQASTRPWFFDLLDLREWTA